MHGVSQGCWVVCREVPLDIANCLHAGAKRRRELDVFEGLNAAPPRIWIAPRLNGCCPHMAPVRPRY
jgi:hypothetical protein